MRLPDPPCQIHATAVALNGCGLLILGASGAGKSSLALQLMAMGAGLVADDRCDLKEQNGILHVARPDALPKAIEARGFGIIETPCLAAQPLVAVVDLDSQTTTRLPEPKYCAIGEHSVRLIESYDGAHFPAAVFLYLNSLTA